MGATARKIIGLTLSGAMILVSTAFLGACRQDTGTGPGEPTRLRLGTSDECLCALVFVADGTGIFAEHGLDVEVVSYTSSSFALDALLAGEVDAATSADTPIALAALVQDMPDIIATIGRSHNNIKMLMNQGNGAVLSEDLGGSRIGTQSGTAAHFFLHSFMAREGFCEGDVEVVLASFEELPGMLVAGEIDAAAMREPYITEASEALGSDAVLIEVPDLYVKSMNLVVADTVDQETRRRLVAALAEADQRFAENGCEEYLDILEASMRLESPDLCDRFCAMDLTVRLEQALLLSLEDQARWAIEHEVVDALGRPDFLGMVDFEPLASVDPGRVRIIR